MSSLFWKNGAQNHSLISILHRCNASPQLKQIHALIITLRLSQLDSFISKIMSSPQPTNLNYLDYSYRVLINLPCTAPTSYGWNALIRSYSSSKLPNRALSVFIQMLRSGASPDHLTYPFLFKACSRLFELQLGFSVHAHTTKTGYDFDRFVANSMIHLYAACRDIDHARMVFDDIPVKNLVSWNSMVDGYAKCGNMGLARQVFDLMSERDVVSWSSLIDGYVKAKGYQEAMMMFEKMNRDSGVSANEVTMVSVLSACAHLGELEQGRAMHQYIVDNCLRMTLVLRTSLVDMYAKCGSVDEALGVFRGFPVEQTDVLIWNAMIGGLATHGFVEESLCLFTEMQTAGIKPDEITYLCLLSACARGVLVKEAWYFFECLQRHGMAAKSEHYACMVDMLARAGQVAEAYELVSIMPVEPTASMLGALFNGCMNHKRLDLAEIVGKKLIEIQPDNDGRYVGLSNVYAEVRRWDECRNTREEMEMKGVKKTAGYSLVL
ncbi:Pentatricopeptide repeat-containing protein At5g08305 [Linum perenne]